MILYLQHFKTSHVIVYPEDHGHDPQAYLISKHLMLLFISVRVDHVSTITYISKHLMLLFIK